MPTAKTAHERVGDKVRDLYKRFRAEGMTHRQAAKALRSSDELRQFGAGLDIDWPTILRIIAALLPLLLMFI
jgi:hypothetical protein